MLLLLADENFPLGSHRYLLQQGYDIKRIEKELTGIKDHEVIDIAIKEDRVIITLDSDFGELVFKLGYKPEGIIFFRWKEFGPEDPGRFIDELIQAGQVDLVGFFTVIDGKNQIRQRRITY